MAAPKDYYQILGVGEKDDAKTIKKAYHRLARQYHPDVSGQAGEEKFKDINEAYEVLSDPKKRQEYDRMRRGYAEHQSRRHGTGFEQVSYDWSPEDLGGFGSIFDDLFSGAGFGPQPDPVPEQSVTITLEQVMGGTTVNLTVNEMRPCVVCHGRDRSCPRCGGIGQVAEPRRFDVKIPPGIQDGAILRVGDHARIRIEVAPHPRFRRQGDHLLGQLMVAVPLAAQGGDLSIQPLVGKPVLVTIPRHANHGKILRLKGLGLPHRGTPMKGDLLLEIALRFPEPFTAEDDACYQQLLSLHHELGGEIHAPR